MKLHLYTKENQSYYFEHYLDIFDDNEFQSRRLNEDLLNILNGDDVIDLIIDEDWSNLRDAIDNLFAMDIRGEFDWEEKTGEYYEHFQNMLDYLNCNLEFDSGEVVANFTCSLAYNQTQFDSDVFYLYIANFFCGNGEPEGAQLALNLVDLFMRSNQWHIGFYDAENRLIVDVASWASANPLKIAEIKPIVWFGREDYVTKCWSITPDTTDLFVKTFWEDYYEGALPHICKAEAGIGIYYSVWEYGLEYDETIFENIKNTCPIDISLTNVDRTNALYNLIISIYNVNKGVQYQSVQKDLYLSDVLDCNIILRNDKFSYLYIKPYKFKPSKLNNLDKDSIDEILLEDITYKESFLYLKNQLIEGCSLESCYKVWERTNLSFAQLQEQFNCGLHCYIGKGSEILSSISYSINLKSYVQISEINDIVFIKSLIQFLQRGCWHVGYLDASSLPTIRDENARIILQEGKYPVVWFNDSEEISPQLGIWPARSQYILSRIWESASSFCSSVFNNINVNNNFRLTNSPLYHELEEVFKEVKAKCPIKIHDGKAPIDFNELEMFMRNYKAFHQQ